MKNSKIPVILIMLSIIFMIIGGTFAYASWQTGINDNTAVTFTVEPGYSCSANGGENITSNDIKLAPARCTDSNYAIKKEITLNTIADRNISIDYNLSLKINHIDTELTQGEDFRYAITTSPDSCIGPYGKGNFKNKVDGDSVTLLTSKEFIGTENKTYYLYIWLDGNTENNPNTMNKSFDFSLEGNCTSEYDIVVKKYANLWLFARDRLGDYKTQVTKVEFIEGIPDLSNIDSDKKWNLGTSPSASTDVMGWLVDDESGNGTYKLIIAANGRIYAKNLSSAFNNMSNLYDVDFMNLYTSETTSFQNMFASCSSLTSLDLSTFETLNVTDMGGMFYGCNNLTGLNLNNFDTSKVTNMSAMFRNDSSLTTLNINNFDTSKNTSFCFMFQGCSKLNNLDLSNFDTSSVTNMYGMFTSSGLNIIDLSSFDTSNVTDMGHMFSYKNGLTTIYVSSLWNTNKVTNSGVMFHNCVNLPNFNSSVTDKTNAHYGSGGYLTYKAYYEY